MSSFEADCELFDKVMEETKALLAEGEPALWTADGASVGKFVALERVRAYVSALTQMGPPDLMPPAEFKLFLRGWNRACLLIGMELIKQSLESQRGG